MFIFKMPILEVASKWYSKNKDFGEDKGMKDTLGYSLLEVDKWYILYL